jgi:hypothetical protein
MTKKYLFLIALAFALNSSSQNLIVDANEFGTQLYNLNTLRKITFSDDSMSVYLQSGQVDNWSKTDIRFMVFENDPLKQNVIESINLRNVIVYPNPSEGFLKIEWTSLERGNTNFEILDVHGKSIFKEAISVFNTGKQKTNIDLPTSVCNGIYFLKVNQNNTSSYQKVIVQK